ncbi:glycine cleavage system protein GcvH [Desulfosporosinus sp. PR]|uniref:glycine cleavage system protein GcvH n=1 Tax=Candidatus Desulfosporosinus nitrosoreducens TaxID=3401928 RepID=UPI0027F4337B|nr:glycine cleavage system protein GcvH [Desulfosporosinus sp. PR]MDQ7096174.1 glycine cleavage system protein GcvH [Desulfosporosinus sp. PR]
MTDKMGLEELTLLEEISYDQEHIWVRVKGEEAIIGISDFAQDQLGEVVFIELPSVGETFKKGDVFGQAESLKSLSALYMPVSGEVTAVNENLTDAPDTVNKDPYQEGWMLVIKPADLSELENLFSKEEYVSFLKESE